MVNDERKRSSMDTRKQRNAETRVNVSKSNTNNNNTKRSFVERV